MKDDWTLTVEKILYVIAHAERWRTIKQAERALQNVNKMEKEMREEQRKLQPNNDKK